MAVTPIRRSMSVVPSAGAAPMAAPAPMSAPMSSPQGSGWVWNGAAWCWDPNWGCPSPPNWGCPPACPPSPCPPQWGCQPCPPLPVPPLTGPIVGVTDGSDAAPGQVGEFIKASSGFSYSASPVVTTSSLSVIIVQPGDWDLWAFISGMTTNFGGAAFYLNPVPTGMSNNLGTVNGIGSSSLVEQNATVVSAMARGLFSVPTLLAFTVTIDQSNTTGILAGSGQLSVEGRRRR